MEDGFDDVRSTKKAAADATVGMGRGADLAEGSDDGADDTEAGDDGAEDVGEDNWRIPLGLDNCS